MTEVNQKKHDVVHVVEHAIKLIDDGVPLRKHQFEVSDNMAYAWELLMQTLRWYPRYVWVSNQLLNKPIQEKYRSLSMFLVVALVRLDCLREANHHVVNQSVSLVKELGYPWAQPLVNQILRAFLRQREELLVQVGQSLVLDSGQPQWLVSSFKKRWPEEIDTILASLQQKPRLWVNCFGKKDVHHLQQIFSTQMIAYQDAQQTFYYLEGIAARTLIEQRGDANIYIQDLAAQMLGYYLNALPVCHHVLDACSAPGGKAFILLKHQPNIKLTCGDISEERQTLLRENLAQISTKHPICFWVRDATSPAPTCSLNKYDLVVLDAPCSGSGVMKRHVEKKYQPWRLAPLVAVQKELLKQLWSTVKPGGYLLYATCSILPEENIGILQWFLEAYSTEAIELKVKLPIGIAQTIGWQILPSALSDGHYFALIKKY